MSPSSNACRPATVNGEMDLQFYDWIA